MGSFLATLAASGRPRAVGAWALASLVALGAPASAQDGAAPGDASRPSGAGEAPSPGTPAFTLEEETVRVPRGEVAQAPASATTVVKAETFQGELRDVGALLVQAPGVEVQRFGTRGQASTVAIRGVSADSVKVLVDGLPLSGVGGGVDLSTIPRAWVSRLEVVRGPAGAAFGSGAVGGVVNVVTPPAAGEGLSAELAGGSLDTWSGTVDGATRVGGFTLLAGATAETTSGRFRYLYPTRGSVPGSAWSWATRENNGARRGGLLLKLGGPAGDLRLDALLQLSAGHRELAGTPYLATPKAWQDDGRVLGMLRLSGQLTPRLTLSGRVHLRGDLLDLSRGTAGVSAQRQRGGGTGVQLEAALVHVGGTLTLLASGEGERYGGLAGGARARGSAALALSEDWQALPRLRLAPAVRVERIGRFSGWSGTLGAQLRLLEGVTLRASGSRTFRVPSFDELYLEQGGLQPNPDLRPASGLGADAAVVYDGRLGLLSVGGFALREDDTITYEQASLATWKPFNTPSSLMAGAELEAATAPVAPLANLSASAAYTFLHTEVLGGPIDVLGNALPRRPRHTLVLRLAVAPGRFEAHAGGRWVRHQFRDERNEDPIPDATAFDAGISWRFLDRPHLSVHLQVDNVTDVRTLQDGFDNPLPGRTALLSIRFGTSSEGTP